MIILTATMHPGGDAARAYELLHATIENRTKIEDALGTDRYVAHVLSRPNRFISVSGYEADVEIRSHKRSAGPAALIAAVLESSTIEALPEARRWARIIITDAADFEQRLRARGSEAIVTISKNELAELREKAWKYEELCK